MAAATRLSGVLLEWYSSVNSRKQRRVRTASAWLCLLAVALLYAPLAGAALLAHGLDCCVGGFCTIPEHHHHKSQPAASQDTAPMDCGHEMSGMKSCSMSCCKDPARPALIPGAFVLPPANFVLVAAEVLWPVQPGSSLELSRLVKPLSPPPRFAPVAL
jgi:hypothetical protein